MGQAKQNKKNAGTGGNGPGSAEIQASSDERGKVERVLLGGWNRGAFVGLRDHRNASGVRSVAHMAWCIDCAQSSQS